MKKFIEVAGCQAPKFFSNSYQLEFNSVLGNISLQD
jgi:hypothetical protein